MSWIKLICIIHCFCSIYRVIPNERTIRDCPVHRISMKTVFVSLNRTDPSLITTTTIHCNAAMCAFQLFSWGGTEFVEHMIVLGHTVCPPFCKTQTLPVTFIFIDILLGSCTFRRLVQCYPASLIQPVVWCLINATSTLKINTPYTCTSKTRTHFGVTHKGRSRKPWYF